MRIAICLSHFYPAVGGAERQLQALAERWTALGHEVFVLTRLRPDAPRRETIRGVDIRREIRPISIGPLFGLTFRASLGRLLRKYADEYDVVLAGQAPWEGVVTGALRLRGGKPALARIASTGPVGDVAQLVHARGGRRLLELFRGNDRFLAPSAQVRDELLGAGVRAEAILPMTNGVDTTLYRPSESLHPAAPRTLLFSGRLAPAKNPWGALQAFARIDRSLGARLLVAGDGPLRAEMQSWTREHNLHDSVEFLGECRDMPGVYSRAGILLQTSPNEGCSNSLLEAMSCALCPVATLAAGNRELVRDGETGLTTPLDDPSAAAAACDRLLRDGELRGKLGQAARDYVLMENDLNTVARRWLELLEDAIR